MGEKTVDMTKGSILPKMIRFALPVLLGMLFQRIYNFVDVYIVGRYLGDEALAAVSIAGGAMYLLFSIMMGLTTGVSVVVSQYYGGGNEKKVTETFVSSIYVAVVSTLIITIAGLIGARPLLRILQTSNDLIDQATVYLMVVFAGAVGTMLYNWISAVLRSLGNSVVPLVFLIISSVLNVILDIVFVVWIPMGVAGAAFATVLAQLLSGIGCLVYAWKILPILQFTKEELRCDRELVKQMLIYGVPTGLQMSIISVSDMTLQAMVNTYGTALIVAYGVCIKVEGVGWQMAEAIGTSLGTFTGQNVGANHLDRVKQGVRYTQMMVLGWSIFVMFLMFFFGKYLTYLFVDPSEQDVVNVSVTYFRTVFWAYPFLGSIFLYRNTLQGMGYGLVPMLGGVFELVARTGIVVLIAGHTSFAGVCMADPTAWIAALIPLIPYYFHVMKRYKNKSQVQVVED